MSAIHITVGTSDDLDYLIELAREEKLTDWPVPKGANPGDSVLFLVPSRSGSIVAEGVAQTKPVPSENWSPKFQSRIGNIRLRDNPVPIEVLRISIPEWGYPRYARGYTTVPDEFVQRLARVLAIERPFDVEIGVSADEVPDYFEGEIRQVWVNSYERDADARRACINHYQARCAICEIDFGLAYGPVAEGFIHVHHLRPLSQIQTAYKVDPILDLRPVCPNCHAVLHRRSPEPYSIEDVKKFMREQYTKRSTDIMRNAP